MFYGLYYILFIVEVPLFLSGTFKDKMSNTTKLYTTKQSNSQLISYYHAYG